MADISNEERGLAPSMRGLANDFMTTNAKQSKSSLKSITSVSIPPAMIEYYDVSGSTYATLREELDQLAPMNEDGKKGYGMTKSYYEYGWEGFRTDQCKLDTASVSCKITVIFPRWVSPPNANPNLIYKWNKFIRGLKIHEQGHVKIDIQGIKLVLDVIKKSNCKTAESNAENIIKTRIKELNDEYNRNTEDGKTQNAFF